MIQWVGPGRPGAQPKGKTRTQRCPCTLRVQGLQEPAKGSATRTSYGGRGPPRPFQPLRAVTPFRKAHRAAGKEHTSGKHTLPGPPVQASLTSSFLWSPKPILWSCRLSDKSRQARKSPLGGRGNKAPQHLRPRGKEGAAKHVTPLYTPAGPCTPQPYPAGPRTGLARAPTLSHKAGGEGRCFRRLWEKGRS